VILVLKTYLPTWDPAQVYPPLTPFQHYEHGKDADPSFPDILTGGVAKTDLTPATGSELRGAQLSSLNDRGKDQLALPAAQRKVLVFSNQNFADLPIEDTKKIGQ